MRRTFAACLLGLLLAACSSHGAQFVDPPQQHHDGLAVSVIKDASGVPQGVHVTWPLTANVAGYHLYRSPSSIPDASKGDSALWTQPSTIPQGGTGPIEPPNLIGYDDIFPVLIGDTFFYRVSAVGDDGDESPLSLEASITIAPFQVITLLTPSVPVDGFADISGLHFGIYDDTSDVVGMPGVEWLTGVGFSPVVLAPAIDQWKQDSIRVTVPLGATSGPLTVTIGGVAQSTPENFVNADPYLTGLSPLSATSAQTVTLTGNHFGNDHDGSHRVVIDGVAIEDTDYVSYSDQQIVFKPSRQAFDTPLQVRVLVDARLSNTGYLVVNNQPPTADLSASASEGEIPFEIEFDASGSSDPDGFIASYDWDWEGDGTIDFNSGTDATVSHIYTVAGDYTATCIVTDSAGGSDSDSVALTMFDDMTVGLTYDPIGDYYAGDTITVNYDLGGGMATYTLDWYLSDGDVPPSDTLIANDSGLPAGTGSHVFDLDTLSGVPVPGSNKIPLGKWQIHVVASDSTTLNDGDPDLFIPRDDSDVLGFYNVYRHNVGVVIDAEGDKTGSESSGLQGLLEALGYQVVMHTSTNLTLAAIQGHDAIVWASDGPASGRNPFDWLGQTDTNLLKSYINTGKSAVIFGVPARFSDTLFPDDPGFDQNYQPFDFCAPAGAPNSIGLHDFASANDYTLTSFSMDNVEDNIGSDGGSNLLGGNVEGDFTDIEGGTWHAMAARKSPAGGTLFFGMVTYSQIGSVLPAGSTPAQLLDNIVDGSIDN